MRDLVLLIKDIDVLVGFIKWLINGEKKCTEYHRTVTSERFLSSAVQCIHTKESKARKEYNLEKKKKKAIKQ